MRSLPSTLKSRHILKLLGHCEGTNLRKALGPTLVTSPVNTPVQVETSAFLDFFKLHIANPSLDIPDLALNILNNADAWLKISHAATFLPDGLSPHHLPYTRGITWLFFKSKRYYLQSTLLRLKTTGLCFYPGSDLTLSEYSLLFDTHLETVTTRLTDGTLPINATTSRLGFYTLDWHQALRLFSRQVSLPHTEDLLDVIARLITLKDRWISLSEALQITRLTEREFKTRWGSAEVPGFTIRMPNNTSRAGQQKFLQSDVLKIARP